MNELIKITYDNDRPTVSARELRELLSSCDTFEDFFCRVSDLKVQMDREELKLLRTVVKDFLPIYENCAITHLCDTDLMGIANDESVESHVIFVFHLHFCVIYRMIKM